MKDFFRKNKVFVLIFLLFAFLLLFNLGKQSLHSDEAEVFLASQNIFDSGVPKGVYEGVPFFENAYLYRSNSSMYEFSPTNYYHTDLVLRKGWLPYYVSAFTSLFGKNEFLLRLPFALMMLFSLFFFFRIVEKLFAGRTALIASFFFAVNPAILFYGRMVRYYAPLVLFLLGSVYFLFKAVDKNQRKDYVLTGLFMLLLFYTHILVFFSLGLVLLTYYLIRKKGFVKELFYPVIIIIIGVVPWLLGTSFFRKLAYDPGNGFGVFGLDFVRITVLAGLKAEGLLLIFFYIGLLTLVLSIIPNLKIVAWKKETNYFLLLYLFLMTFLLGFFAPVSSFEEKLFLPLIPVFLLLAAQPLEMAISKLGDVRLQALMIIFIVIIPFIPLTSSMPHNFLSPKQIFSLHDDNVYERVGGVIDNQTNKSPLVFATGDQFPLTFYTDYNVQIVWPVKKDFLDEYDEEFFIIEMNSVEGTCNFFYQHVNPEDRCDENKNYVERIEDCKATDVNGLKVYHCPERKRFLGGGLGLFFADFPEGSPPDFIWDREPFPLAVNVKNHGESDVESLKVVPTGAFAGDDFDLEREVFVFDRLIPGKQKEEGTVITSSEYFDLGNVVFNHKLPQSQRYVNASVKLCYPYQTTIRVHSCEYSAMLCSYEVSGAPIGVNVDLKDYNLSFDMRNTAEGSLGSYEYCGYNSSNKTNISIFSESFICRAEEYFCEVNRTLLKPAQTYLIQLDYDYEQEFKKALLLRSKDRNQHDYEAYKQNN